MDCMREAANSIANGIPSRRRQISATASVSSDIENPGATARARSMNRAAADESMLESTSNGGTGHSCSSFIRKPSRLDVRIFTVADCVRMASIMSAHAVQWSYDLLDDDEKGLLASCSVFAGGFDLAAACAVIASNDELSTLDSLDALVRKSLLVADRRSDRTRFSMLETIRQFAEEQLVVSEGAGTTRTAHARHFARRLADVMRLG
jgi:hypothetical protein